MGSMYSPIIKCSNESCLYHHKPLKSMFVKKGKGKGYQGKMYQRYQCKACGTTFSSRTLNWTGEFKKPELVRTIFQLYTSGCSIRRLAIDLGTTKATVSRT
jgi:transposase-like protein